MSWLQSIKTEYIIITGDGKIYKPLWINAQVQKEYNYTEFVFVGVKGSFVDKQFARGARYSFEIVFQGDDCLTIGASFLASADDKKNWVIQHPMYGKIFVQCVAINLDNSEYNISRITGSIIETIGIEQIGTTKNSIAAINAMQVDLSKLTLSNYSQQVPLPVAVDYYRQEFNANTIYSKTITNNILNNYDFSKLTDTYYKFKGSLFNELHQIKNVNNTTIKSINYLYYMASLPARFTVSVASRISVLSNNMVYISKSLTNLLPSLKVQYEGLGSIIMSAMCGAAITNIVPSDYTNADDVILTIDNIYDQYRLYMTNLESLQTENGALANNYISSPQVVGMTTDIVIATINSLFEIAAQAKTKKNYTVIKDTNIITLAYELLGLKQDDSTINELISINNISSDELLLIPIGRVITYYS